MLDRADVWLRHAIDQLSSQVPGAAVILSLWQPSARGLLLAAAALILILSVPPLTERILRRCGSLEVNFRGDRIPQSYGLAILGCAAPLLLIDGAIFPAMSADRLTWLACLSLFGLLGLIDDARGDPAIKGLRGHFQALVRGRRVTTGLVKALGGLAVAIGIGWRLHPGRPIEAGLSALVIALSANALNLLDLRPGRACATFSLLALALTVTQWRLNGEPTISGLLYVALPALVVWVRDAAGRAMLGDAGSNLLGAAVGLGACLTLNPVGLIVVLSVLVGVHAVAERRSINALIEATPVLRAIDRLTGVR